MLTSIYTKSIYNLKCNKIFKICSNNMSKSGGRLYGNTYNNKKKVYSERKLIGFSMEQIFSVVSDVRNYHKFVPFCKKSEIVKQNSDFLQAKLVIGFPPLVESYTSNVTLIRPKLVKAVCVDGRLFDHLDTTWRFSPALKNNLQSCIIDFHISFEFKSVLHSNLAHLFFDVLVRQMEEAFIKECKARYGQASVPTQQLNFVDRS